MFFLYVTHGLPACGGHNSNKYCVTVYGSILIRISAFFQNGLFCQTDYIVLIFIARCRHNFRAIAAKNCEKSEKSAENFVRTTSSRHHHHRDICNAPITVKKRTQALHMLH